MECRLCHGSQDSVVQNVVARVSSIPTVSTGTSQCVRNPDLNLSDFGVGEDHLVINRVLRHGMVIATPFGTCAAFTKHGLCQSLHHGRKSTASLSEHE
jgi:hypothetical protein